MHITQQVLEVNKTSAITIFEKIGNCKRAYAPRERRGDHSIKKEQEHT